MLADKTHRGTSHPVYVVSGGTGASGEQLVHTVLVQFPDSDVHVTTFAHVRQTEQIRDIVSQALAAGATIVHTLVDADLRNVLLHLAGERDVPEIDLMGPLLAQLSTILGQEPIAHPGLFQQLHQAYYDRVAAIEFSVTHDDGRNTEGWARAEIVLTGVSRVGKTPLSMYLAVMGWKVANVPLVSGIAPPAGILELDRRRVFGLHMDPGQLLFYRQQRQSRLGAGRLGDYADPAAIHREVETARALFRRQGFTAIDVTDRPIESSADQIVELVTRRLKSGAHRR